MPVDAEGYVLSLRCDHEDCFNMPNTDTMVNGVNKGIAYKNARDEGWKISKDGKRVICPKHT